MKTEKYTDPIKREVVDDNIKMEVPDEIATDKGKINFKNKISTEVCHVCAKEFWGRLSLLQHMKVHEGIQHQCDKCSYKTPTKKYLKGAVINAVIDDLAKDSEQRKKKVRMDERPARESADKAQPAAAKAGEADGPSSARFNRRGNRVPVDSPPDLLTDAKMWKSTMSPSWKTRMFGRPRVSMSASATFISEISKFANASWLEPWRYPQFCKSVLALIRRGGRCFWCLDPSRGSMRNKKLDAHTSTHTSTRKHKV